MLDADLFGVEPPPKPSDDGPVTPFVLDQRPGPDGYVYVTWSLAGLRRATVRVPLGAWLDGHHFPTGALTESLLSTLDIEPKGDPVPFEP